MVQNLLHGNFERFFDIFLCFTRCFPIPLEHPVYSIYHIIDSNVFPDGVMTRVPESIRFRLHLLEVGAKAARGVFSDQRPRCARACA